MSVLWFIIICPMGNCHKMVEYTIFRQPFWERKSYINLHHVFFPSENQLPKNRLELHNLGDQWTHTDLGAV